MVNIVLVEPRTAGNVGTIGRTVVALGGSLHLIRPYGWGTEISDKEVKKAGLDYWKDLDVTEYNSIEEFWEKHPLTNRHFFATTKTKQNYFDVSFNKDDFIYFGREDAGLPQSLLALSPDTCITIPMKPIARSLNLSNAVSIVSYEAIKQNISQF
jgi:tRNA (cytidine/uridine-2'-O-)-methyltransferase